MGLVGKRMVGLTYKLRLGAKSNVYPKENYIILQSLWELYSVNLEC